MTREEAIETFENSPVFGPLIVEMRLAGMDDEYISELFAKLLMSVVTGQPIILAGEEIDASDKTIAEFERMGLIEKVDHNNSSTVN